MKVTILIDLKDSFFWEHVKKLLFLLRKEKKKVLLLKKATDLNKIKKKRDVLFMISCRTILSKKILLKHKKNVCVHPSKLPLGRGSAAVAHSVLSNKNYFYISLFEVSLKIDSGPIYLQEKINLKKWFLNDEIRRLQGIKTIDLILKFLRLKKIKKKEQKKKYPLLKIRKPQDSILDINKSLKEQFNLLRICDNERYPAFFYFMGKKFILKIYNDQNYIR